MRKICPTKLYARKGKNLAIDFDVSDAARASFGGQTSGETHDGKKLVSTPTTTWTSWSP